MTKAILWLLSLIIFFSCKNKSEIPAGILKPDKMQAVLWDIIKADAFTTDFIKKDSSRNPVEENLKLQREIFAIHNVSKDVFYKSYDYYKQNSGVMKDMIDSMIRQSEKKKEFGTKALQAE